MAPKRKGKRGTGTLHYALEVCDRGQLTTIVSSKSDVDGKASLEVMNCVRRSKEIFRDKISPLQGAVTLGHYNICKHLVEEGAGLKSVSTIPHPLCLALQKGHFEIAQLLLKAGADVNLAFEESMPMSFALDNKKCTIEIVDAIINAGFPKDGIVHKSSQRTTLHAAVRMNHFPLVKHFLSMSVDPNMRDVRGLSPMHYAVQKNYPDIVKFLAENGAIVDCECIESFTPMFYATATGNYDIVKLLISLGSDVHFVNGNKKCSMTPLHFAANFCQFKICQLLLENGANVNTIVPLTQEIALHAAARADTQNIQQNKVALDCIAELLIKEGSNLEARHKFGLTPLQVAIKSKNVSVAKILVLNGSQINNCIEVDGERCYTTFHIAAKCYDKDLVKLCIDYGADIHVKDDEGLYPCHLGLLTAMLDFITHSAECSHSVNNLQTCNDQSAVFKFFWRQGFPFDLTLKMRWLENSKPPIPIRISSLIQKQKMLFNGLKTLQPRVVQRAIDQGAEVRCCSTEIQFPLHYIASKGNEQIMKMLLSKGLPVNCLDKRGETPLHIAAKAGHLNCCRLLLEYGACYNYTSQKCLKTPLELARDNCYSEVVSLLSKVGKYFRDLSKGKFRKLKKEMTMSCAVINCCGKNGMTLMGTAVHLDMIDSAKRLMELRLLMSVSL